MLRCIVVVHFKFQNGFSLSYQFWSNKPSAPKMIYLNFLIDFFNARTHLYNCLLMIPLPLRLKKALMEFGVLLAGRLV